MMQLHEKQMLHQQKYCTQDTGSNSTIQCWFSLSWNIVNSSQHTIEEGYRETGEDPKVTDKDENGL